MKKSFILLSVIAMALLTACNKPLPTPEELNCNPNPLTVVGNEITAEITGTFPAKKFNRRGVLEVTPVLKYDGKEYVGETVTYVGEKAKVNGKVVNYKKGGTYKQVFKCPYAAGMEKSELYLRFKATAGKKEFAVPDVKVADGLNTTAHNAEAGDVVLVVTPDKFQRIIEEQQEADIKFLINQSTLRSSETRSEALRAFQAAIAEADAAENVNIASIDVNGYASPDGALELNTSLAERRQVVAQRFLNKALRKAHIDADVDGEITAEDWEGFQRLMENSNIQDKELVLRVLSMYNDPEEREAQIKNLSAVFQNIAQDILPALRRSRLVLTTQLIGKSDEEIKQLAKENPAALNIEELLYAATLVPANERLNLYKKVAELFPADYRAYNNMAICYFNQANIAEARRCFAKALSMDANNADINFNAGVVALAENDLDKAEEYFGKAAGTKGNLAAAMGTLYTLKGDYTNATKSFTNTTSNNAAVQQILNEDYAGARKTLAAIAQPTATTHYLKAIVAARTNDREGVYASLREAIAADANLKAKALKDIEFAKYAEDSTFLAIVK